MIWLSYGKQNNRDWFLRKIHVPVNQVSGYPIIRKLLLLFSWSNLSKEVNRPSATLGCKTNTSEKHTTRPSCTIQRHESHLKNCLKTLTCVTKIAMENKTERTNDCHIESILKTILRHVWWQFCETEKSPIW